MILYTYRGLSEDKCQEMELLNEQKQKTIDNLEKRVSKKIIKYKI